MMALTLAASAGRCANAYVYVDTFHVTPDVVLAGRVASAPVGGVEIAG